MPQIKIHLFVSDNVFGKLYNPYKLGIKVLDDSDTTLLISSHDFDNFENNKSQQFLIIEIELSIKKAVERMVMDKIDMTSTNLFNAIYRKKKLKESEINEVHEKEIWNEDVKKFF